MIYQSLNNEPILKVENIFSRYDKKDILLGASLSILPGEIVTIVGTNGSGKSTLLKTIFGITKANAGRIIFNKYEITKKEPYEINRLGISFLMQGGQVFPSLTVEEHLQICIFEQNKNNFKEKIESVWILFPRLYTFRNKRVGFLSGGEKQMLAISMLLMQDSKLCLLDEPSGGLAMQTTNNIFEIIKKLNIEKKITMLLVEQNLYQALNIANRAYILKDGKTFEEKNPMEILSNGKLEEIFFK